MIYPTALRCSFDSRCPSWNWETCLWIHHLSEQNSIFQLQVNIGYFRLSWCLKSIFFLLSNSNYFVPVIQMKIGNLKYFLMTPLNCFFLSHILVNAYQVIEVLVVGHCVGNIIIGLESDICKQSWNSDFFFFPFIFPHALGKDLNLFLFPVMSKIVG